MKSSRRSGIFGFVLGCLLTALIILTPVFSAGTSASITAMINSVSIMLDGNVVGHAGNNYVLSNGSSVPYSIVYKGTTYLPIRKVGELVNKEINYISESKTVVLGALPAAKKEGWHLVKKEFVNSNVDSNTYGPTVRNGSDGKKIYDNFYIDGSGTTYLITAQRTFEGSNDMYYSKSRVTFTDMPDFMQADSIPSITLTHQLVESDWNAHHTSVTFSSVKEIGYGAFGEYAFYDSSKETTVYNRTATLSTSRGIHKGSPGNIMYLKVVLGHGYGYRYTYEWKTQ